MNNTVATVLIIVLFIGVLILNYWVRIRRQLKSPLGMATLILANINYNERRVENFGFHRGAGKMKTGAWKKNKNKVDFLPQELQMSLSQLFDMVEEVNDRIDAARSFKSDSYMSGIDVSKLKAPLAENKERLYDWIQDNMNNPAYQPKRRRTLLG